MQDYYEILQVHPKAEQDAIAAAYERLMRRYDIVQDDGATASLSSAAEVAGLVELARHKREEIERAYATLSDSLRRAAYDQQQREQQAALQQREQQAALQLAALQQVGQQAADVPQSSLLPGPISPTDKELDYRPLPPARRQERPKGFEAQPLLGAGAAAVSQRRAGRAVRAGGAAYPSWLWPAAAAGACVALITFITVLATSIGNGEPATGEIPLVASTAQSALEGDPAESIQETVDRFDALIPQAQEAAKNAGNNPEAWIVLGNAIYDSVQMVRENLPDSELYKQRIPRWLEASAAYEKALALQPGNADVRADRAASLCYYGAGTGDQEYVNQGIVEVQKAVEQQPETPRIRLNLGVCLAQAQPPQTERALESWRQVATLAGAGSPLAVEAQRLIEQYSK